jgi:hypothetical protein
MLIGLVAELSVANGQSLAPGSFSPATNSYARRIVSENFRVVDDLNKIDPEVLAAFHEKVPAREIANRGERFNSTDVVTDKLPFRRLVFAGNAPGIWFILYEHGGIAYYHNLVVFTQDGKWRIVASVTGIVKGNDFESLKQAVASGKLFDHSSY